MTDNYDIDELSDVAISMDENGSTHFSRARRARTGIEDPTDPEFPDEPPPGWAKPE